MNSIFDFYAFEYSKNLNKEKLKNEIKEIWKKIWVNYNILLNEKKQKFKERFYEAVIHALRELPDYLKYKSLKIYECFEDELEDYTNNLEKRIDGRRYKPDILSAKQIYKEIIITSKHQKSNFLISMANSLPGYSCLIEIEFKLKKPYLSKDDDNFYIIDNPIAKDKIFKLPMVRSTTWKGALRFAARFVDYEGKDEIIVRLFGNEKGEESNFRQGRLFFYPTFFDQISLEVITPLSRETRTPVRGPIYFEIVPENTTGTLRFLYYPFDLVARGEFDKIKEEMRVDLKFLSKALRKMFYEIGFSAKKTSGFGTAEVISVDVSCGEKLKEYKNHVWAIFKDELKVKDGVNNGS